MTEAGLGKIDLAVLDEEPPTKQSKGVLELPRFVQEALTASPRAWEHFQKLAPSYRRNYIGWIMDAKKEETRERRLREAVSLLEQNKKLGLK